MSAIRKHPHSLQFDLLPLEIQIEMKRKLIRAINNIREINITETVSEFAMSSRTISKGLSANFGQFNFDPNPYMREICDNLSDSSPILETYLQKCTQIGYNVAVIQNYIAYCVKYGIGPLLYVGGDQSMAEEEFEKRVDEALKSCGLQNRIRANINKSHRNQTGDRVDSKSYAGTFMRAIGPNSENKAASFPVRALILDEEDKYPVQLTKNGVNSGDIVQKLKRRQDSYDKQKKLLAGTTPKSKSISRIESQVEEGDKRYYNIKCPQCGIMHPLIWNQFKWDKKPDGTPDFRFEEIDGTERIVNDPTYHECPACGYKMRQKEKHDALQEKGYGGFAEWIPTKKSQRPFVRSYLLNGLYGFRSWVDIMVEFLEVKDDPLRFPDFQQDVLGETTNDNQEKPEYHELLALAMEYEQWDRGFINKDTIWLSLTCDVQGDRLEYALCGWARNKQAYLIDYWTSEGDTNTLEDICYKQLYEKITSKYIREDGVEMYVKVAFIDSQYRSQTIDAFCDQFPYDENTIQGVFPLQSRETSSKLVKFFDSAIKTPVIGIHDQKFKHALYDILRKKPNAPGQFPGHYFHFSHQYSQDFFEQLTSEEIISIKIKGVDKCTKILNTKQRRNEVLDICKMHLACYQFVIDRYFEIINEQRKLQKQEAVQQSETVLLNYLEQELYS